MKKTAKQLSTSYLRQLVKNHNLTLPTLEQNRDAAKTAANIFNALGIDAAISYCVSHGIEIDAKDARENPARYMEHLVTVASNMVALAVKGREATYTAIKLYQSQGMESAINYCKLQGIAIERKTADNSWDRVFDVVGRDPEHNEYKPNLSGFRSTATGTIRTSTRLGHVCHNLKGESDGIVQTGGGSRKLIYTGRQVGIPQKYRVQNDYKDKTGKTHAIPQNISKPAVSNSKRNEADHYTELDAQVDRLNNAAHDPNRSDRQRKAYGAKAGKLRKLAVKVYQAETSEHAPMRIHAHRNVAVNVPEAMVDTLALARIKATERAIEEATHLNNAVERGLLSRTMRLQSRHTGQ